MLTPLDDLLGHQTPEPFAQAGGGDPRFTERFWYTGHPTDGSDWMMDIGLGYYPNLGVMDAYAGVTIGRRQHNFRASRQLGNAPLATEVGPLRLGVVHGMQCHRLALADNQSGIAFDLEFDATLPPARERQSRRERDGVVEEDLARVTQFGRWRGWISVDGQRRVVDPGTWWGQRDRSWGLRSEMRTDATRPPVATHRKLFWTWSMFQFEHRGLSLFIKERGPGDVFYLSGTEFERGSDGHVRRREVTRVSHVIQWADDPLGQTITEADFTVEFDHGPPRLLRVQGLVPRYYLKAGLYGGYQGWMHGDDRGPYHAACDVWDLDDAATRASARTLSDHAVRIVDGLETGWGISEYGVASGYPLYPAPQRFPAI